MDLGEIFVLYFLPRGVFSETDTLLELLEKILIIKLTRRGEFELVVLDNLLRIAIF